jgi:glycosyltransferase involved in cell wall biosynthesis
LLDADYRLSQKTEVLYSPVRFRSRPLEEGWLADSRREFTIGIVGRITQVKGHHLLLEAAGNLPPKIRDRVRILIVGAPAPESEADLSYADYLRTMAIRCDLQKNIVWAGFHADPGHCYDSMDVLVHPALWDEAMGLVILEALQRGIPVIAARIGGIPEIVDDGLNGLLVAPGDKGALVQALVRFIEDGVLREHLRHGARSGLDDRFTLKSFSPRIRRLVWRLSNLPRSNESKTPDKEFTAWK